MMYYMTKARRMDYKPRHGDDWGVAWDINSGQPHPGYQAFDEDHKPIVEPIIEPVALPSLIIEPATISVFPSEPLVNPDVVYVLEYTWHYGPCEVEFDSLDELKKYPNLLRETFKWADFRDFKVYEVKRVKKGLTINIE